MCLFPSELCYRTLLSVATGRLFARCVTLQRSPLCMSSSIQRTCTHALDLFFQWADPNRDLAGQGVRADPATVARRNQKIEAERGPCSYCFQADCGMLQSKIEQLNKDAAATKKHIDTMHEFLKKCFSGSVPASLSCECWCLQNVRSSLPRRR